MMTELMPLLMALLGLAGCYLRWWKPSDGFWKRASGHALLSLGSALVGAASSWLASGQLSEATAVHAAVAAMSTWVGSLMPPGAADAKGSTDAPCK